MERAAEGRNSWPLPIPAWEAEAAGRILDSCSEPFSVLVPFCGAGAVTLACAERGWDAVGLEPNPFLRWAASVRSCRFSDRAAERAGYAWARVADDVFWENEQYRLPDVPGTYSYGGRQEDFLRRVRFMIDRENRDETNDLLRMSFCSALETVRGAGEPFDDRVGNDLVADSVEEIRSSVEPNPRAAASVRLCDPKDIPLTLRKRYGLIVSSIPSISPRPDADYLRTCMRWIGFDDLERADRASVGYPLGDIGGYMSGYVPRGGMPSGIMLPDIGGTDGLYVRRYFEELCGFLISSKGLMAPGCEAHYIVRDGKVSGRDIPVAGIFSDIAEGAGFTVSAERTGPAHVMTLRVRDTG